MFYTIPNSITDKYSNTVSIYHFSTTSIHINLIFPKIEFQSNNTSFFSSALLSKSDTCICCYRNNDVSYVIKLTFLLFSRVSMQNQAVLCYATMLYNLFSIQILCFFFYFHFLIWQYEFVIRDIINYFNPQFRLSQKFNNVISEISQTCVHFNYAVVKFHR